MFVDMKMFSYRQTMFTMFNVNVISKFMKRKLNPPSHLLCEER